MRKSNIEKRIKDLESGSGVGGRQYIQRIIFDFGLATEGDVYREIRWLMKDDGSEKGRCIRTLEPGEKVPGLDNPPWLREGAQGEEDPENVPNLS